MIYIYIKSSYEDVIRNKMIELLGKEEYTFHTIRDVKEIKEEKSIVFYEVSNKLEWEVLKVVKEDNDMKLIVLCEDNSYMMDSFEIKAFGYLNYQEWDAGIDKLIKMLEKEIVLMNHYFHYSSKFMKFNINPEKVYYVESYRHEISIYTKYMKFKIRDTLKKYIINNAYLHFIQVHKSFVVNAKYIKEIHGNEIYLENDVRIPLGENYKESLNTALRRIVDR